MASRQARTMAGGAAALLLGILAVPAAADSGAVGATVTVGDFSTCIQVVQLNPDPGGETWLPFETLDFGVLEFGDHMAVPARPDPSNPDYFVLSCTETYIQDVFVAGTDAANAERTVEWALTDGNEIGWPQERPGVNQFVVGVGYDIDLQPLPLIHESQFYGRLDPENYFDVQNALSMPDLGSDGIGEQMGFDIIWTAVAYERAD